VQVDAVDAQGIRIPSAANRFSLSIAGPGRIVGVGNGNPRACESFVDVSAHALFFGKALAVVRRTGAGCLTLVAAAEGLESTTLALPIVHEP